MELISTCSSSVHYWGLFQRFFSRCQRLHFYRHRRVSPRLGLVTFTSFDVVHVTYGVKGHIFRCWVALCIDLVDGDKLEKVLELHNSTFGTRSSRTVSEPKKKLTTQPQDENKPLNELEVARKKVTEICLYRSTQQII